MRHCQCCCNRLLRLESRSSEDWQLNKRWQNIQPAIARDMLSIHVLEMGHFLRGNCRKCSRCLVGLQERAHISDAVSRICVDGEAFTFIAATIGCMGCVHKLYKLGFNIWLGKIRLLAVWPGTFHQHQEQPPHYSSHNGDNCQRR